uniref:Uncharacterized protein n=1 Tax=Octopus bimaculoides TaxID=37653 RepID=A0A0L8IC22_OCTBM
MIISKTKSHSHLLIDFTSHFVSTLSFHYTNCVKIVEITLSSTKRLLTLLLHKFDFKENHRGSRAGHIAVKAEGRRCLCEVDPWQKHIMLSGYLAKYWISLPLYS